MKETKMEGVTERHLPRQMIASSGPQTSVAKRKGTVFWPKVYIYFHFVSSLYVLMTLICRLSTPVAPWLSYSPLDPRFTDSNPAGVDGFFQSVKILSMTSFGREVKLWVPCRRFTVRKRTSNRN